MPSPYLLLGVVRQLIYCFRRLVLIPIRVKFYPLMKKKPMPRTGLLLFVRHLTMLFRQRLLYGNRYNAYPLIMEMLILFDLLSLFRKSMKFFRRLRLTILLPDP